jgi:hypothetical protein
MQRLHRHNIEGISYMLHRISHIRAVNAENNDKRLTQIQIKSLLAKTSLPPMTKTAIANAFFEGGMLSDGSIKAAAAKVDNSGRYSMKSIDAALASCSPPLAGQARMELKGLFARCSLI